MSTLANGIWRPALDGYALVVHFLFGKAKPNSSTGKREEKTNSIRSALSKPTTEYCCAESTLEGREHAPISHTARV